jgi:hypothetical protein
MAGSRNLLQDEVLEVQEISTSLQLSENRLFVVEGDREFDEFRGIPNFARQPEVNVDLVRLGIDAEVTLLGQSELHVVLGVN